ncbi:MAG: hypothetical protein VB142_08760 [Burkholderia sp.]
MHFGRKSEQLDRQIENLETSARGADGRARRCRCAACEDGQRQGREQQGTRLAGTTAAAPAARRDPCSNPIRPARSAALRCRCSVRTCPSNLPVSRHSAGGCLRRLRSTVREHAELGHPDIARDDWRALRHRSRYPG